MIHLLRSILIFSMTLLILNCGKEDKMTKTSITLKPAGESALKKLSAKKIYFGHQSVGYNIMDGVKEIVSNYPELKIIESKDANDYSNPVFGHSRNGKNVDPKSKIDAFEKTMNDGLGQKTDIAFFKFCYVDFNTHTDVNTVFNDYVSAMERLKKKYPKTRFVHVTSPLSNIISFKNKSKDFVKKIIGRQTDKERTITANIKRNEFNELIKEKYSKEDIFDLADIESTYPDSKKEKFSKNGKDYYALVPEYTYDGGHLNNTGKRVVAGEFLKYLSGLIK
jgi:hypothetical protein